MTPWCQAGSSFGGGNPWGEWLVRGGHAPPGTRVVNHIQSWVPPGLRVAITSSNNGNNVNNNQQYGWLLLVDPTAQWADPGAEALGDWFDLSGGFYIDLYAMTAPDSSELRAKLSYTFGGPTFFGPLLAAVSTSMGLDAPAGVVKKRARQSQGMAVPEPFLGIPGPPLRLYNRMICKYCGSVEASVVSGPGSLPGS